MKKLIFGVVFLFFWGTFQELQAEKPMTNKYNLYPGVPEETWVDWIDAYWWIRNNIEFVNDVKGRNIWQSPGKTLIRMKGDCEDVCILFMQFVFSEWRMQSLLYSVMIEYEGVVQGHMMIIINPTDRVFREKKAPGYRMMGKTGLEYWVVDFADIWKTPEKILKVNQTFTMFQAEDLLDRVLEE